MLEFSFPDFYMPFPAAVNPAAVACAERLRSWSFGSGLRPTEAARRQFARSRPDIYIARSFPDAEPETLTLLMQWVEWGFVIDDELDDGPAGRDIDRSRAAISSLLDVIDGDGTPANAIAVALRDLWERTVDGRSPDWQRRFLADLRAWLWTYYVEAIDRLTETVPSLEEYRIHVRDAAGMLWFMDLYEIAAETDLPEQVVHLASHVSMRFAAVEHAGFLNDIISARKEDPLGCFHNAVHILCRRYGRDLQDAVEEVNEIATECIARFEAAEKAFPAELALAGVSDQVHAGAIRCRDGYRSLIRGIYDWHFEVDRYAPAESTADGDGSGVPDYLPGLFDSVASAGGT